MALFFHFQRTLCFSELQSMHQSSYAFSKLCSETILDNRKTRVTNPSVGLSTQRLKVHFLCIIIIIMRQLILDQSSEYKVGAFKKIGKSMFFSNIRLQIAIFYTDILTRKVVLWSFFMSEMSEKSHNYEINFLRVKISTVQKLVFSNEMEK